MSPEFTYTESLDSVLDADLTGFLAHWDFEPAPGALLRMLRGSSVVILAREARTSRICGYVAALTDGVVCGYISAIEVRPEQRHRGVGTELLRRVTERLEVHGVYLSCAPDVVPFYAAAGFRPVTAMAKRRVPPAQAV